MSSWKEAKTIVEASHPEGWGKVLELPVKKDQSRLGYQSPQVAHKRTIPKESKWNILPFLETFTSVGHLREGQISLMGDEDNNIDTTCLVYQKAQGDELINGLLWSPGSHFNWRVIFLFFFKSLCSAQGIMKAYRPPIIFNQSLS